MLLPDIPPRIARLGFHYYPDTLHYRDRDLRTWLPELRALGASWLTVLSPYKRAIPEKFLRALQVHGIQPIVHFQLPLGSALQVDELNLLFCSYARWGVRYVVLFDRPNCRENWSVKSWAQTDLVERFLDQFLPLAEGALQQGLVPVFPPLEPGGDYWDLSFLRASLRSIKRRGYASLMEWLHLGVYAWWDNHPLTWGAGGPERWPKARPYFTPPDTENHLGFHIFDWYLSISQQETGRRLPLFLLRAGERFHEALQNKTEILLDDQPLDDEQSMSRFQELVSYLASGANQQPDEPILPPEVLACNFWLLAAEDGDPHIDQAWFRPDGDNLPLVNSMRRLAAEGGLVTGYPNRTFISTAGERPIEHYVLLPLYAWEAPGWDPAILQPILEQTTPLIGFSLLEARKAARVTVVGGEEAVTEDTLEMLRASGCLVERIVQDGTLIAP